MSGQFESLRASSLYCRRCGQPMPVREKLLLVLPDKEIYDYLCTGCADSLGQREVTAGELIRARSRSMRPARRVLA
ncbi:MAG: cytoplasmic protein [Chthoniobacterales bacterium]|nr:cytoplasmic protein [Chthoniobacterales bacterium]